MARADGSSGSGVQQATLTLPIERAGKFVFELGGIYFEVDPATGGRVSSLKLDGIELLTGPAVEPVNWGSTFWPSPQSVWFWPPPAEFDNLPYRSSVEGHTLSLAGDVNPALGLSVSKRFTPDLTRRCVLVEYSLTNHGSSPTSVAPWEITRVFPRGLSFYPTGDDEPRTNDLTLPVFSQASGATWLDYEPSTVNEHQKLFADGSGGYLAHATDGVLLVKVFDDLPLAQAAPGESEIQLYLDGHRRYIELEQQGPYTNLAPGQTFTWSVRWYLRRIPSDVPVRAGSVELLALASSIAAL